jgi:hypothetical protein
MLSDRLTDAEIPVRLSKKAIKTAVGVQKKRRHRGAAVFILKL